MSLMLAKNKKIKNLFWVLTFFFLFIQPV